MEQFLTASIIVAVATVAIVVTVASAGTAAPAMGLGITAAFGGSGATATTITTIATWGCYGIATGIGACAASDVTEVFTGYNPIRDEVMGGNQQAYSFVEGLLYTGAACIAELAANNQGLKPEKENKQSGTKTSAPTSKSNATSAAESDSKNYKTYYQVTSKENAKKIANEGLLRGNREREVYAWSEQPTKSQARLSGARSFEAVISFEANSNVFEVDKGLYEPLQSIGRRSTRPGPIPVKNVRMVGFK